MSASASTVVIDKVTDLGQELKIEGHATFSAGDYAAGGIALSFAQNAVKSSKKPSSVVLFSTNGNAAPAYVAGTTRDNGKVKMFASPGTEYTVGALGAEWTGDTLRFVAFFPKGS